MTDPNVPIQPEAASVVPEAPAVPVAAAPAAPAPVAPVAAETAPVQPAAVAVDANGNPVYAQPGYQYPAAAPRPALNPADLVKYLPLAAAGLAFFNFIWIFLPAASMWGISVNYMNMNPLGMLLLWVFVFAAVAAAASYVLPKFTLVGAVLALLAGVAAMTGGWGVDTQGANLGVGAILMGIFGILLLAVGAYWTYLEVTKKD